MQDSVKVGKPVKPVKRLKPTETSETFGETYEAGGNCDDSDTNRNTGNSSEASEMTIRWTAACFMLFKAHFGRSINLYDSNIWSRYLRRNQVQKWAAWAGLGASGRLTHLLQTRLPSRRSWRTSLMRSTWSSPSHLIITIITGDQRKESLHDIQIIVAEHTPCKKSSGFANLLISFSFLSFWHRRWFRAWTGTRHRRLGGRLERASQPRRRILNKWVSQCPATLPSKYTGIHQHLNV